MTAVFTVMVSYIYSEGENIKEWQNMDTIILALAIIFFSFSSVTVYLFMVFRSLHGPMNKVEETAAVK